MGHCQRLLQLCQLSLDDGHSADLRFVCRQDGGEVKFNTLLLAAAAPWLSPTLLELCGCDDITVVLEDVPSTDLEILLRGLLGPEASHELEELFDGDLGRHLLLHEAKPSSNADLPCKRCGKMFTQRKLLNRHFRTVHSPENPYTCRICSRSCRGESELKIHARIHTNEKPHQCFNCGKSFAQRGQLNDHLNKVHKPRELLEPNAEEPPEKDKPTFTCDHCSKVFAQKCHLNVHYRTHTGEKPHMCSFCGKLFSVASNFKKHLQTHQEDQEGEPKRPAEKEEKVESYECSKCPKRFKLKSALKFHEKVHSGEQQYNCDKCHLQCVSKSALDKHSLVHTGERPHQCPVCSKAFVQKSHVNYHLKTVHGSYTRSKQKVCFECGAAFALTSTLNKHMSTHNNVKPYVCDFCGKAFIQKVHLKTHELRHTGERPFLCFDCGRSFLTSSGLKEHQKLHLGTKTHKMCPEPGCGAKYRNPADLKVHMRRHTGQKPFRCQTCTKSFVSKRLLDDHQRIHTGSKPFVCKNCGKAFTAPSGLRLHFKRHDTCRLSATPGTFSLAAAMPPSQSGEIFPNLAIQAPPPSSSPITQGIDDFGKETTVFMHELDAAEVTLQPGTADFLTLIRAADDTEPMTFAVQE